MDAFGGRTLSLVEAARAIFRTGSPTEDQVRHVEKLMRSGALRTTSREGPPLRWTTSKEAVAELLAAEALRKQESRSATTTPSPGRDDRRLQSLYLDLWKDYFLSVLMRRKTTHRSTAFRRAVMAGQALFLVGVIAMVAASVRLATPPVPPERAAVEKWIDAHTDRYRIIRWHPVEPYSDGPGSILRVEYSYTHESPRPIQTDRRFLIVGNTVTEVGED